MERKNPNLDFNFYVDFFCLPAELALVQPSWLTGRLKKKKKKNQPSFYPSLTFVVQQLVSFFPFVVGGENKFRLCDSSKWRLTDPLVWVDRAVPITYPRTSQI